MRFEQLTIQNINSWQGHHTFDFDDILKGEDLFAITGPTGSGKSTILLSLSLALYGRGPKGLDAQDYISMGQEEASVELNSTIRGKRIRAQWTIQKGKTPKRNVWIDGKAVSKPKTAIEELIGLNFDQFSKTIILNQGEFSRFLTSTFTERKEILEHLSGIHELSSLIDQLKQKRQLINQEWELVSNQIEALPKDQYSNIDDILNDQKINDQKLESNEKQQIECDKLNKSIKSYLEFSQAEVKIVEKINRQDHILKELHPQISNAKSSYDNSLIELAKLNDRSNSLKPIFERGLIIENNLNLKKQNLNSTNEKNNKNIEAIKQLEQVYLARNSSLTNLKNEYKEKTSPLTQLSEHDKTQSSLLFNKIKELSLEKQYLGEQFKKNEEQKAKSLNDLKETQKKLHELSNTIISLNPKGQSVDEMKLLYTNLSNNEIEANRLKKEIQVKKEKLLNDKQFQQKIINEFERLTKEFQEFNQRNKKTQLEQALRLCHEASLEAGHCLICGHDQLPHSHKTIENWIESSTESFNEELLKNTEIQVLTAKERISLLQHEINSLEINFHALPQNESLNLSEMAEKLKKLEEIDRTILPLQSMIPHYNQQIEKIESDLAENLAKQERNKEAIDSLLKQLNSLIHEPQLEIILKDWEDWQKTESHRQKIHLEIVQLESLVQQNVQQKSALIELKEQLQSEINNLNQQIELLNSELFTISKGRSIKECQLELENETQKFAQEHSQIEKNWRDLTHKREMEANTHSILSNDLKACHIDVLNSKTKITKIIGEIAQFFEYDHEIIDLKKLLSPQEEWNSDIIGEIYQLKLLPFLDQLKSHYEEMAENRGKLKSQIEEYKKFEKYFSELTEKFKKINSQKETYEELYQLMVKGDFRGFALSFIEESLVTLANHELDLLCGGRYRLIQQKDSAKSQVDFMIIDSLHGGEARKISTLSGGETFMVSLGLALALSEMMRGKTEIDSFFIDEGFGALDPDSIEEVLEILFNVQMRGKTIGLISHVKSLTSRIPINIELFKDQFGYSDFRIHKN